MTQAESKIASLKEKEKEEKKEKEQERASEDKAPSAGTAITVSGQEFTVAGASNVMFTKATNKKAVTVPGSMTIGGREYLVTGIGPKAFTGKKIRTVTIGRNVTAISKKHLQKAK